MTDFCKQRLELAVELGASHIIDAEDNNLVEQVRDFTKHGVSLALDTSGSMTTLETAIECLAQGGRIGIVSATPPWSKLSL